MKHHQRALTRSTQAVTRETRHKELLCETSPGARQRVLWIDGVGGFQLIEAEEALLGQAIPGSPVDIAVVGDLSRRAAAIRRSAGDYLLQPLQAMTLNGKIVDRPQLLADGDELQLGKCVKLGFHKPSPLSATARLSMLSLNRFKPSVDSVLLLADSCIIGPNPSSHVHCPNWKNELLLFRKGEGWVFRTLDEVEVNGVLTQGQIPMEPGMRIGGEDFSLSIE